MIALVVLATIACPRLPPAASLPQNALDIRPDQVQVVAAVRLPSPCLPHTPRQRSWYFWIAVRAYANLPS